MLSEQTTNGEKEEGVVRQVAVARLGELWGGRRK